MPAAISSGKLKVRCGHHCTNAALHLARMRLVWCGQAPSLMRLDRHHTGWLADDHCRRVERSRSRTTCLHEVNQRQVRAARYRVKAEQPLDHPPGLRHTLICSCFCNTAGPGSGRVAQRRPARYSFPSIGAAIDASESAIETTAANNVGSGQGATMIGQASSIRRQSVRFLCPFVAFFDVSRPYATPIYSPRLESAAWMRWLGRNHSQPIIANRFDGRPTLVSGGHSGVDCQTRRFIDYQGN